MIFVTVGGQVAFDRLIETVDRWAGERGRDDVFCQILDGAYEPKHASWERELSPADFEARLLASDVIVAHAGMGTIITALEKGKPIVILPRKAALKEQRNDHQLATAQRFRERGQVRVAMDEAELRGALDHLDALHASASIGDRASDELLTAIRTFVAADPR